MPSAFEWTIALISPAALTYYAYATASSSSSSFIKLWLLFMVLDAAYGHFFHLFLLVPARYLASCLPGAQIPPLNNETELVQQESESNDPSIIWPSKSVLQQVPKEWLPTGGVVHDVAHDHDGSTSDNGVGASKVIRSSTPSSNNVTKKRRSNKEQHQSSKLNVSKHTSSPSAQPYYLNHARGSTRVRQASQRLGMAMGTLFATYLTCNPSFCASSSFTKLDNVGLQFHSMQQVLSDLLIGILIGSTIVVVIFSVEVYMGWIKIAGYWEKVVPEERFGLNLLWDGLFHVGVSVNEELT